MKTLWTFGCSFTAEYYPYRHQDITSNYDLYEKWRGKDLADVWPTLLSKKLNYELKNLGIGGSSNYSIIKRFIEHAHLINENDIVIIGWTNITRFQLVNVEENTFNEIQPGNIGGFLGTQVSQKSIDEIFVNRTHSLWIDEIITYINFINFLLFKNNTKIFHWTSDYNMAEYLLTKYPKDNRYIKPTFDGNTKKIILSEIEEICNLNLERPIATIFQETNGIVKDCHFGEYGHITQSEYFYNYIKNYL